MVQAQIYLAARAGPLKAGDVALPEVASTRVAAAWVPARQEQRTYANAGGALEQGGRASKQGRLCVASDREPSYAKNAERAGR